MENLDLGTNDEEDEDEDEEDIASPVAVVFIILVPVYLLWVQTQPTLTLLWSSPEAGSRFGTEI